MNEALLAALASRYDLKSSEEWQAFLTHLDFSDGFALFVLLAPDDSGVEICRRKLERQFAEKKTPLHSIHLAPDDPPESLSNTLDKGIPAGIGAAWVQLMPSADSHEADQQQAAWAGFLRALNPERNPLRRHITVPLIFAGPAWLQQIFRESAPDLWSVRRSVATIHPRGQPSSELRGELRMPNEQHFAPPDSGTRQRIADLRHDLEIVAKKAGAELLRAELLRRLGVELTNLFHWDEAEKAFIEAYDLHESYHAPLEDLAKTARDLGRLLQDRGQYPRARHYFERAMEAEEARFGSMHPRFARACSDLAGVLLDTGHWNESMPLMRRALVINEAHYGANHPEVASDLSNLALLLKSTNRLEEAEPMMRRVLAIDEASYGANHPEVASDLNNLALLLKSTNRLKEAEPMMRRALAIAEASYGPNNPKVALYSEILAIFLKEQKSFWRPV